MGKLGEDTTLTSLLLLFLCEMADSKRRKREERRGNIGPMCTRQALFWTLLNLIPIRITLDRPSFKAEEMQVQEPLGRLTT